MRPSGHFLRVFLSPSFTLGCHWLAVLPGKDCTAALGSCWHAARMDGFRPGWSQELPRRPHCLPIWPKMARGRREPLSGGNTVSSGGQKGISGWELLPTVARAVHAARQARGTHTLPWSSTTWRHLHFPHRHQPLPQQPESNSHEQCNSSDATQGTYHEREKSIPLLLLHCRAAGGTG